MKESTRPVSKARLECRSHGDLAQWLYNSGGSLAISTYNSGKVVLVSCSETGRLRWRERRFARPMGIALKGRRLAVVTQKKLLLFCNSSRQTERRQQRWGSAASDGVFVPVASYETGKLDAHEVAFGSRHLYFVNTRFNGIARPSERLNFIRTWQPRFITTMAPRDRCHLNGLAIRAGRPAMATAFCDTSRGGVWREQDRFTSGVVIDVVQNRVVVRGLSMPHSPRWHHGRWWFCNSGQGTLSVFQPETGESEEVCSLPGFTRGLQMVGDFALVGLSRIRRRHVLDAPPVRARHHRLQAGVVLVDLKTGKQLGGLEFVRGGSEVFDVVFLPGVRRPDLVG